MKEVNFEGVMLALVILWLMFLVFAPILAPGIIQ